MERALSTALETVTARLGPPRDRLVSRIGQGRPRPWELGNSLVARARARWRLQEGSQPMRLIGRLLAAIFAALMVASVAGTIAAFLAKRRIVPTTDPAADEVALVGIFGPLAYHSTAPAFRGGTIDCMYGGGVVDLRRATLHPEGAHLQARALFGGAQLIVPEDWQVTGNVLGLGGLGDARTRKGRPADAPRLTIDGMALFGGFGVTSEMPEEQAKWLKETEEKVIAEWHKAETQVTSEPVPVMEEVVPVG
jgi:hypothetical protein